jgi:hypothetical protein
MPRMCLQDIELLKEQNPSEPVEGWDGLGWVRVNSRRHNMIGQQSLN